MGWDNTTEMVATVVDSLAHLTRLFVNANYPPIHDPIVPVPRPYGVDQVAVEAKTISLSEFDDLLKEAL